MSKPDVIKINNQGRHLYAKCTIITEKESPQAQLLWSNGWPETFETFRWSRLILAKAQPKKLTN